jgi:acyl-CoA synthetase (AMP-forming)/AMP-acid ligase II
LRCVIITENMNDHIYKTRISEDLRQKYYETGLWKDLTLFQIIRNIAERTPEKTAVREKYRSLTYEELLQSAISFAGTLAEIGLGAGDKLAVWLPNRLETIICFLACSLNRHVCCPSLHRNHTVAEVTAMVERFRISAIIHEKNYGADAQVHDLQAAMELVSKHSFELNALPEGTALDYPFVLNGALDDSKNKDQGPDSVVYLPFTSGTTGEPKGVMHSDNTLMANARAIAGDWNFNDHTVIYTLSPLSHNLGFGAMVTALSVGGEIVLSNLSKTQSLVEELVETGATFIYGVPAHALDLLNELRDFDSSPLLGIEGFRISGAAASKSVVTGLLGYGIVPQTGYGMTEAHSHNYTLPDDKPELIIESAGKACPGYELKIWSLDDNDLELGVGEEGQIAGKGASLMLGYYNNEEATIGAFNSSGWYMTGDIGRLDENNYLFLSGRLKDLINRGGHKIYPGPIEKLAESHDDIEKAAVIAMRDERLGERVCIVVVTRKGANLSSRELVKYLTDVGLSRYDVPEFFAQVDELPLTPSGKVMKRALLALLDNGSLIASPV